MMRDQSATKSSAVIVVDSCLTESGATGLRCVQAALVLFSTVGQPSRMITRSSCSDAAAASIEQLVRDAGDELQIMRFPIAGEIRSCLVVPLRTAGIPIGAFAFIAPEGETYERDQLQHGQASALNAAAAAAERHGFDISATAGEVSEEVLRELGKVLHVGDVFSRISTIVNRVLPHDRMTMTFHDGDDVTLQVASVAVEHDFIRVKADPAVLARPFVIFPELTADALRTYEPPEARACLLSSGFLSFLAVNVHAREQRMGVEFWSRRLRAFSVRDVAVARTIANYLAVAVSHEQLADAASRPEGAPMRAPAYEARVRNLLDRIGQIGHVPRIVGNSPAWAPLIATAARVAETDATVLLIGESGTGKELIARFIHAASTRSGGPFAAINCATLPEQLLESELFGHERGAFTGATHSKPGQLELAAGGVLFLDEVSEMSMTAQAKLLRLLQEREFRRLGGTRLLQSNVRVIAATNVDLQRAIQHGQFRRDLYYRLRVVDLRLPPLRDRHEDIIPLTNALLDEIMIRIGGRRPRVTSSALNALQRHRWPGNVRELRNVLERAAILCHNETIDVCDLSFDGDELDPAGASTDLGTVERDLIDKVLRECGGNKSLAAKRLGLSRMQLYVRLRRYDLAIGP